MQVPNEFSNKSLTFFSLFEVIHRGQTAEQLQFSVLLIMFYFGWEKCSPSSSQFLLVSTSMRPFPLKYTKVE